MSSKTRCVPHKIFVTAGSEPHKRQIFREKCNQLQHRRNYLVLARDGEPSATEKVRGARWYSNELMAAPKSAGLKSCRQSRRRRGPSLLETFPAEHGTSLRRPE